MNHWVKRIGILVLAVAVVVTYQNCSPCHLSEVGQTSLASETVTTSPPPTSSTVPAQSAEPVPLNTVYEYVNSTGDYAYSLDGNSFFLPGYQRTKATFHLWKQIPSHLLSSYLQRSSVVPLYVCGIKPGYGKQNIFIFNEAPCASVNSSWSAADIETLIGKPYDNFLGYAVDLSADSSVVNNYDMIQLYHCMNMDTGDTSKSTNYQDCLARTDQANIFWMTAHDFSFYVPR